VVLVPFEGGQPSGAAEDFLTGFIAGPERGEAYGRPVGLALLPDGSLLVADDADAPDMRPKSKANQTPLAAG
jgi:glucose/arabinose dehydrogenase